MPLRSTDVAGVDNQSAHNKNLVESCQTSQVYYLSGTRKVVHENELQVKRLDCMRVTEGKSISSNPKLISNSLIHSNDNFQMNVASRQSQKSQQAQPQFQQLQVDRNVPTANQQGTIMLNEDLLEKNNFTKNSISQGVNSSGGQVNLGSNELMNHTQIIKLVTDNESGNLLIDPSNCGSNTMNTGLISSHHGNSKVHVISNVTFVSKQIGNNTIGQTQQTINVVNAKGVPYLTSKHQMQSTPVIPKIANMPTKNNSGKSGNNGNLTSSHTQNHYLPVTSMHATTGLASSQKSAMPRNVQVVARTQNISASTSQLLMHNMQSPPTNTHLSSQQDLNTASNQVVLQQKIMTNVNANNNSKCTPKKQALNNSLKFVQHKCANTTIGARSSQNYFSQQTPQMQNISPGHQNAVGKLAKSQKLTRQPQQNVNTPASQCIQQINCGNLVQSGKVNNYCQQQNLPSKLQNCSSQNPCTKYVMQTQILSTAANQTPVNSCKVVTTHNSCNVMNTNASVCNFNVLSSSNHINSNSNSNYNMTSNNNTTLHGGTNANKIGTIGNVNPNSSGNLVVIQNNAACGNMSNNSKNTLSGSTIKYVSAHGTVVQSQHIESPNQFSLQQSSQPLASKGRGRLLSQTSKHRNDQNVLDGRSSILPSEIVNNSSSTYMHMPVSVGGKQSGKNEEIMIVNGTQMTEEMSARILQSLSQKALHTNNTKQYQNNHASLSHLHDAHYVQKNSTITAPRSNGIDSSHAKEEYSIPLLSTDCEGQETQYMDFSAQSNQFHNHNVAPQKLQISQQTACSQRPLCSKILEKTHNYERLRSSKISTEFFKVIGDNAPAAQQAEHEDDIGEEIRPKPVTSNDVRIQTLHAVLQDHNYVAQMPTRIPSEIQSSSNISMCGSSINNELFVTNCNATQDTGGNSSNIMQQQIISPSAGNVVVPSNSISPSIGLPFLTMNDENRHDDDANSVISDESRTGPAGLDNDLGEETETAPEAEAEDDSVTRCICDLTHDDGYMICCDKCSAWQHVDCMGIDRQNIPDEYLCEICQPREVDRARAKNLQLTKRREQISFSIASAQANIATLSISGTFNSNNENHSLQNSNLHADRLQPNPIVTTSLPTSSGFSKKNKNSGSVKRKELLKRSKKERNSSKRREVKRVTRRKKANYSVADAHVNDRNNTTINQWLENYEVAVTNHYSPELRARLHAICKQQNVMQSVIATENKILKNCSGMQSKCTTVPFSGGKILISNFDIQPNTPIVELRGKYMLTTQYKTQNPSVNTNNNVGTPHNPHAIRNQKIPGPFIFFYKLCNEVSAPEICVDTRTYANEARFVRRSCRPNAEIQHYFEKGTLHLYLVSTAFINGGTEITIKHEPHDLAAVNNRQTSGLVVPTSTICACDAPKECLFSNHIVNAKISRKILLNGYMSEKLKSVSTKKEQPSSIARGRSVSSSGESNVGLLSPTNQNAGYNNPPSIGNLHNDSGVYTSSSSPSVSLPSPTHAQIISSPTQQCPQKSQNPKTQTESLETPVHSATGIIDNGLSKGLQRLPSLNRKSTNKQGRHSISEDATTPATQLNFQDEKHENKKLSREERKMDAIIRAFEKMEKTQQRKQELKQARSTVAVGKTRTSTSPSPKGVKCQQATDVETCTLLDPTQARKGTLSAKKRKRKGSKSHLTNQQKRRRRINSNDSDILSSGESCLLSPTLASNEESKPVVISNSEDCESRINLQEYGDNSNLVLNDQNINHAAGLLLALANNDAGNTEQVAVAQVDSPEHTKGSEVDVSNVDVATLSEELRNQTAPMVSSTCLLVEAAVAPLENADAFGGEFKLPAKTKTKKSIMNDWLNQSLEFQHPGDAKANQENQTQTQLMQSFDPKGLDTLVRAAATICDYRRSASSPASFINTSNDEAQNISIAAKKVEEFIHQTNINLHSNEVLSKQTDMQANNIDHQNPKDLPVCPPHSINNCLGGSSVKKRWLRQAISEECSDELTTCIPATSPTQLGQNAPVGFTTPLKKRRVIRQCTEDEESVRIKENESPTFVRMNPLPEEIKTEIKDEFGEIEEEVDIINSPLPEEKMYKEDSFVKIENVADIDCKSETLISTPLTMDVDFTVIKEEVKDLKEQIPEIKTENELGEKSCDSKNGANDVTEYKLQTSTPGQGEDYIDVSDEIADIQKRLHSFHTENIMILQSRNKKSKISRSVKVDDSTISVSNSLKNGRQEKHEKGISKNEETKSFKKEKHSSSKRKHLDFEDFSKTDFAKFKEDDISKKEQCKTKQLICQPPLDSKSENIYTKGHSSNEVSDHIEEHLKSESKVDYNVRTADGKMFQAALTIPNFNQTIISTQTKQLCRSNYSVGNSDNEIGGSVLSLSPPVLKPPHDGLQHDENQITSIQEPQIGGDAEGSQPPPLHLPYFSTIYGKLIDEDTSCKKSVNPAITSANVLLSDYLDTKVKSYSTLGGYVSRSALFGLNNSNTNSGMDSLTIGSVNCSQNVVKEDESVSSNDNNNNNSRMGGSKNLTPTTSNVKSTLFKTHEPVSQCMTSTCSKIMTKTASADPRLNPTLTAPEPAPTPKRKLSINEYRKRKQLSSEASNNGNGEIVSKNLSFKTCSERASKSRELDDGRVKSFGDISSSYSAEIINEAKVQFSPTPTLLEQQQETLCERLKSLKSQSSSLHTSSPSLCSDSNMTLVPKLISHVNPPPFNSIKANDEKEEFLLSHNVNISSLESISSSSSPVSSKESTPERDGCRS